MGTKAWGEPMWHTIHFVALGYPESPSYDQRAAYRAFFTNLDAVIPCKMCAKNYADHLQELPLLDEHLDSGSKLFAWTVKLHNIVNRDTGPGQSGAKKKQWTAEEARDMYMGVLDGKSTFAGAGASSSTTTATASSLVPWLTAFGVAAAVLALVIFLMRRNGASGSKALGKR